MSFLRKLFGKKTSHEDSRGRDCQPGQRDPANDPNMIRAYDGYGREVFITRQQWKDNVLLGNLKEKRDDPDQLYGLLVGALQDGFAADIVPYAEHLWRTDPVPSRGATILAVVYMENNRLDDAERTLKEFLSRHGDDGVVLTNLAKIHSRRGDDTRAESILWHALEVDPNQENGLDWYAAIHRERGGETSALDACRRVAALPRSWRAQLWIAREALQRKDLAAAKGIYAEVLSRTTRPTPTDALMQMSGDLGNNGFLAEIVQFVEPHFDPAMHGLPVGNNLIKAHHELGRSDAARRVLDQLFAQKRPDWQESLRYWDTELAKADVARRKGAESEPPSVVIVSVEGPLWTRDESPFAALLPKKSEHARKIAIFGSTALLAAPPGQPEVQLSDAPGRVSRAIPLLLAEKIHLGSDAVGIALIPWVQNQGFALFGRPYGDQDLCLLAGKSGQSPDFLISATVDASRRSWGLMFRLIRMNDGVCVAEDRVETAAESPGQAVEKLAQTTGQWLVRHAGVHTTAAPQWYGTPIGHELSDYLLRLEQQLAVACMHLDFLQGGGLSGEHEILDGILQLCVRQPTNQTVRMVFAQTLRQMQKVRPGILPEYREKVDLLRRDHPLTGRVGELIERTIAQTMAGEAR